MNFKIVDVQKFLLSKQIFWDGKITDKEGHHKAEEPDFYLDGKSCKMVFLNGEEQKNMRTVLAVNNTTFQIKKESLKGATVSLTTLYDFSPEWCEYMLKDADYAKNLLKEAYTYIEFWKKDGKEKVSKLEEQISKVKAETKKEVSYWSDLADKACAAVKQHEANNSNSTM